MTAQDFLRLYSSDGLVQTVSRNLDEAQASIRLKGLAGGLDSVLLASLFRIKPQDFLVILEDREEAAYVLNDLQNLLQREILFFPMSYKRPYEFEETENANILQRAEILNKICNKSSPEIIVTYPDALVEKVITRKSLSRNTFSVRVGASLDMAFLEEFLHGYDFEKTEFVYEAGQFSIRGGIVDVYSFANELPYRVELLGNEVESIRTFDPSSQISVESLDVIHILPNVQQQLVQEERQSFLEYIDRNTVLFIKDLALINTVHRTMQEKLERTFAELTKKAGAQIVADPGHVFTSPEEFGQQIVSFRKVEYGSRTSGLAGSSFEYASSGQPSFNKNFELLANDLYENQVKGYRNFIASDMPRQLDKLHGIFEEINTPVEFQALDFSIRQGFIDHSLKVVCYTDHQIFERFHKYRAKERFTKSKALTLRELQSLHPGDFVTHIDYGIGKFAGLEKRVVNGREQEAIRLVYRDDDILYVSIHSLHKIARYTGKDGALPPISKLGSQEWELKKKKVKGRVKDIAKELIELYAKRKSAPGFAFTADGYLQAELETSFIYEDTPDQSRATEDVKRDMESPHPMDRLVCGDVGFGKTEVAIRATFKAVNDSKQVVILVPTTILAMQHYRTFKERLGQFPVRIEYLSRFRPANQVKEVVAAVKKGEVDILIGTHRLVSKDIEFKDLGLLVIDEEQKFGVKVKDRLKELKVNVDVLTLTATPIPRTLHFSLMGARDLSIIATPPPNRQPVTTELHAFEESLIRDAVSFELKRGGQVFFVHNRISDIEEIANIILRMVPDAKIGIAHGQMDGDKLERAMLKFIDGEYDVLVSTNIIESGLDIPNANTIIINQAHMFGLSDLHQMRGRVGRSNRKAFCYLLTPPASLLTADSRKRLSALEEFSDLGAGFKVAMRDLDIRGAGNLLGAEQTGFISDLGFETYHKILDEAIQELKESDFKELFSAELAEKARLIVQDCVIETDLEILIPETYVNNVSERLQLYSRLDNLKDEVQLDEYVKELKDRFGTLPASVLELINSVRLRWLGERLGFEKISIKGERLRGYFVSGKDAYFASEVFGRILNYVKGHPKKCKIKDASGKASIVIDNVKSVDESISLLTQMESSSSN